MGQRKKLIEKIKNNPKDVRFKELESLLNYLGLKVHHIKDSHFTFKGVYDNNLVRITIVKPHGKESKLHPKIVKEVISKLNL